MEHYTYGPMIYVLFHAGATGIAEVNDDLLQQSSDQVQNTHKPRHDKTNKVSCITQSDQSLHCLHEES